MLTRTVKFSPFFQESATPRIFIASQIPRKKIIPFARQRFCVLLEFLSRGRIVVSFEENLRDFTCGIEAQDALGELISAKKACLADGAFDNRDIAGRAGELVDAKPEEQRNKERIGCDLAANGDCSAVTLGLGVDHFDHAQNAWMRRVTKVAHRRVAPVDAERILDEVVGPDRKEIAFFCQSIADQNGGRNFDHAPDGDVWFKRDPFFCQSLGDLGDQRLGSFQFANV